MATRTLTPATVAGRTTVWLGPGPLRTLFADLVYSETFIQPDPTFAQGPIWLELDPITGKTSSVVKDFPDLGNNVPIMLGFYAKVRLEALDVEVSE